MNIKRSLYIELSDASTTKLANERHSRCTFSYLLWFWLPLVAAVCTRNLPYGYCCYTCCCVFANAVSWRSCSSYILLFLSRTYGLRVSSYLPQTYDDELKKKHKEGDMKWHGLWPQRSEHSGIVRCGSTALVHACSKGRLSVSGRAKASAKGRKTALRAWFFCLEIDSVT